MNRALLLGGLLFAAAAGAQEAQSFRRHELALFPFTPQVDAKFTEHRGSALSYRYRLRERVALEVFGQFNWHHGESRLTRDLIDNVSQTPTSATGTHLPWMLAAGTTLSPVSGDLMVAGRLWRLSGSLSGGVGLAQTEVTLGWVHGEELNAPTGHKPLGYAAVGLRAQPNERLSLRLEVRRQFLSTHIETIHGCTRGDMHLAGTALRNGSAGGGYSSDACAVWASTVDNPEVVASASSLMQSPSSDILTTTHVHAGLSVLF